VSKTRRSYLGLINVAVSVGALGVLTGYTLAGRDADRRPTVRAAKGTVARVATLAGIVWPAHRYNVWPKAMGRVATVSVVRGQLVTRGAELFRLDASTAHVDVERRRLGLERATLRRQKADGDGAEGAIEVAQAKLDYAVAVKAVEDTIVRAPIDGRVVLSSIRPGDVVVPSGSGGVAPMIVATNDEFVVEVDADEFEIAGLREGQRAVVRLHSGRAEVIEGEVAEAPLLKRFAPGPVPTGVFGVTVRLGRDAKSRVMFGSSVTVEVEIARRQDVVCLPISAVTVDGDVASVLEARPSGTVRRVVTLGLSDMKVVEVSDLPEGTLVLMQADGGS
jgi:multidrug resistance efflux pump